jgi:hypothetical protein
MQEVISSTHLCSRRPRQNPDGSPLVCQFGMGVDAQRQPDIAVPGQGLGDLGTDAGALETGD